MKNGIIFLVAIMLLFVGILTWQCTKESIVIPEERELPSPGELITLSKMGEDVSVAMVNDVRQKMLDDLIKADQDGQWKTANPGAQDTTGVNAIWQLYKGTSTTHVDIWSKIKIFNGSFQPQIYSMCFIMEGSPNLRAQSGYVIIEDTSNYNFIDFPPMGAGYNSVIYNAIANKFYFVFFSLTPFTLDWVDKVVCVVGFRKMGTGDKWVTINRLDPNNFALSSDGYTDYVTYFFPDTLVIN